MADVEHIFRRERRRVVGRLVRLFGDIDLAEEAFQDALVSALKTWPESGTPDNPGAWLMTAAKRRAIDVLRRQAFAGERRAMLVAEEADMPDTADAVADDQLRLIFTCCHPALAQDAQVALTLKVVAGFTVEEIARAFLVGDATMAQRIVRAKRLIAERQLPYVVPDRAELPARLDAVLAVVYLLFNEGYTAREGALMRLDLQSEALRLGRWLCELMSEQAEVFGLFALMAFSGSRSATRVDAEGVLLLLSQQDRSRWDGAMIREGLSALQRTRTLGGGGAYAVQAELAALHATAPNWEATDWDRILFCYDALLRLRPSPVIALNRAVAVCMRHGAEAGLLALAPLEEPLSRYHLFFATRADFLRRLGRDARPDYERALATNDAERAFLMRQL